MCAATAAPPPAGAAAPPPPVARTSFLVARHLPRPHPGGAAGAPGRIASTGLQDGAAGDPTGRGAVCYGDRLVLVANPLAQGEAPGAVDDAAAAAATGPPCAGSGRLVLVSRPAAPGVAARLSRHQLVAFSSAAPGFDAAWEVAPPDPLAADAAPGAPVRAGAPVLLVHAATRAPLCLEAALRVPTADFGVELEVSAHLAAGHGMQQGLEHAARVRWRGEGIWFSAGRGASMGRR
jgi:hypothetical protein